MINKLNRDCFKSMASYVTCLSMADWQFDLFDMLLGLYQIDAMG